MTSTSVAPIRRSPLAEPIAEDKALNSMMTRAAWIVLALLIGAVPCVAQDASVVGPTPVTSDHDLLRKHLWSTLGRDGAIRATLASGFEQRRDAPTEWGAGATGYAKRWASEFAESAVGDTTTYLVARLLHHDPSFTPFARCECSGLAQRLGHAASSPFIARRRDGTTVLSPASVVGLLAGHVVPASTWYPSPGGAREGLKHVGSDLIGTIGVNVVREFWPHRARTRAR